MSFVGPTQSSIDLHNRLELLERAVLDIHWICIGQFLYASCFQEATSRSAPVPSAAAVTAGVSKSRSRRERARQVRQRLWGKSRSFFDPAGTQVAPSVEIDVGLAGSSSIHNNAASSVSTVSSVEEVIHSGDFRCFPAVHWVSIHSKFQTSSSTRGNWQVRMKAGRFAR